MDKEEIKRKVWEILPAMTAALVNALSVYPMYNAKLSKSMGVRPYPSNRGNGNFLLWTLLRDERTADEALGVGALDESREVGLYSNRNIVVNEWRHNDAVENYEQEVLEESWRTIQGKIAELCELLKEYIKAYPETAYGGAFIRDMDINLCEYSASGEFVDYLIKALLYQEVLEYTGEKGPRGSYLLRVARDVPYEVQPRLDPSKFRSGVSRGEALAAVTFTDFLPDVRVVHQKKWKACRDKKELPFDFYDEENGIVVEVDGAQHFRPVQYFGGDKSFDYVKSHDSIKNRFVLEEDLRLIRIDSSTRDVRDCLMDAYSRLDTLPVVSLYGEGYGGNYCGERFGGALEGGSEEFYLRRNF